MAKRKYGYIPSKKDKRDFRLIAPRLGIPALPASADLRPYMPPIYDQDVPPPPQGSCVANAIAAAFAYDLAVNGAPPFMPSRDFIYWNARVAEGETGADAGCEPRDALNGLNQFGVCDESLWAYDGQNMLTLPTPDVFAVAMAHAGITYCSVDQTTEGLRSAISSGLPIITGLQAYASLESDEVARSGDIPMPAPNEQCLGGHCMLLVGYSTGADGSIRYLVRNSWGIAWGLGGMATIPENYLVDPDLTSDLWCLQTVN